MINQLGKFTPNINELSHPLRELLIVSVKRGWLWGPMQADAFTKLKQELTSLGTLQSCAAETLISADASSHGIDSRKSVVSNCLWIIIYDRHITHKEALASVKNFIPIFKEKQLPSELIISR